jgi:hypothetical protein
MNPEEADVFFVPLYLTQSYALGGSGKREPVDNPHKARLAAWLAALQVKKNQLVYL